MTNEELSAVSQKRKIDRISVVTDNVHELIRNLEKYFQLNPWTVTTKTQKNGAVFHEAILPLKDGMELQAVEPVSGESVYMDFYKKFGKGIMGMRERVAVEDWDTRIAYCKNKNIAMIENVEEGSIWLDLTEKLGSYMSLIREDNPLRAQQGETTICQICIVTDDVLRTAHDMCELLQVGPWEIGNANNTTFLNVETGGYAPGTMPEFLFKIGIGFYGSLQMELIQPVTGPLPYFATLNRRGIGFHHIKKMFLSRKEYEEAVENIRKTGLKPALGGTFTIDPFMNWATEDLLGFVFEMNDNTPLGTIPKEYEAHMVQ